MEIDKTKIKTKLQEYLKREPTPDEIINGAKDQNIVNSIILDMIKEQDKMILELQDQLKAIKK